MNRFFNVVSLLCDFFTWFLKTDGSISDTAITEITTSIAPVGSFMFAATTNVGSGWLFCNGGAVSRTTYASLFAAIGTRYGIGDGTTTFNLPDGRGRSLMGSGQGTGLTNRDIDAAYYGTETVTLSVAEMPAHTHDIQSFSSGATGGDGADVLNEPDPGTEHTHTTGSTGGGAAHANVHPVLIAHLFIKT